MRHRKLAVILLALLLTLMTLISPLAAEEKPFGGVGLQVVPTVDGYLVVLNVLAESPAAEQGIRPGDLIVRVDDFDLQVSDFGKVIAEYLWGPVGSSVTLVYRRPGLTGTHQVTIARTRIDPQLTVSPAMRGSDAESRREQP
ncbi:MAG: PDZ domain-containing protein [Desulfuromonadales bacterium]